jgi:DNA-binding NtrC family response regulator
MSRKILVVDDDPILRKMFCRQFKRFGFDAIVVPDAGAAREVAGRMSVAVALTDYHLEGANGLDLLEDLAVLQPDATLVVMSGDPTIEDCADERGLSRMLILLKPFNCSDLADLLREALARHLLRATSRERNDNAAALATA